MLKEATLYVTMECIKLECLRKHQNSQSSITTNSSTGLSKTQFFPLSIVKRFFRKGKSFSRMFTFLKYVFFSWAYIKVLALYYYALCFKVAWANMIYFARNKFLRSLVHKKNFGLIWQIVFKLEYLFYQGYFYRVSINSAKSCRRQLFLVIL